MVPPELLFADKFREDVVSDRLDFALRQTRRMRIVRGIIPEFGRGSAVAALVLVGELVEMRHFGSGTATRDHFDHLLAIENRLVQIGRLSWRTRIASAVAIDPVAVLAIRLAGTGAGRRMCPERTRDLSTRGALPRRQSWISCYYPGFAG